VITIKSEADFDRMAVAGRVVAKVLEEVRAAADPGISMQELDALAARVIEEAGCRPSFLGYRGYPAHICTSPNEVIVHGIPGRYRLREGDILSVDAGAIYEGLHADAAITFPIGEIEPEVEKLLRVTEEALWAAIALAKPGSRLGDLGHAVQTVAEGAGFSVVREYVGHGIGRLMHEEPQIPNYGEPGRGMKLRTEMAICLEPMVNVGGWETRLLEDNWTVVTADGSLSAHFEHTVALRADGPQVLTTSEQQELAH
jgi:methionyl aminopeptidase